MDNWADPWADNADNARTPTKPAVTSPLPPTFAPAPALLHGFLDDAGWGNDDDSFGDWSTASATVDNAAPPKTSMNESYTPRIFGHASDEIERARNEEPDAHAPRDGGDWADVELHTAKDEEKVASEPSDTSTTTHAANVNRDTPTDASPHLQPNDDLSTRASTSPSEASHNEALADSPRTSYEEEHGVAKTSRISDEERVVGPPESSAVVSDHEIPEAAAHKNEDVSMNTPGHEVENRDERLSDASGRSSVGPELSAADVEDTSVSGTTTAPDTLPNPKAFVVDSGLLHELFSQPKETQILDEAPDDPIYSTSGRKAWYRLTRKQTMREFNSGNDDDNYIRVTWANSHIKSEVNKIVGRWTREDRLSGTGPGARASFYWDTSAPTNIKATNMPSLQHSAQSASPAIAPKRESIPPLSTDAPAAFSWSSASAPVDPWHQASLGLRTTPSSIAPIQPGITHKGQQGDRVVSLNLASHKPIPATGMKTLITEDETPAATSSILQPRTVNTIAPSSNSSDGPDTFNTTPAHKDELVTAPVDDEDEWGEMVSTPTVPVSATTTPTTRAKKFSKSASILTTPPQPWRSAASRDQSPETMHAAPIVRLKSTISSTSAHFKADSFIPFVAEQGPIGPGLLKSAKRAASCTVTKIEEKPPLKAKSEPAPPVRPVEIARTDTSDVFSAWQSSDPEVALEKENPDEVPPRPASPAVQELAQPSTPPPNVTASAQANVDAWADADFSFFESSLPVAPTAQSKQGPLDAFSVFESPARSTSSASSTKTSSRSPPRKGTPPPIQPLTGATSSAQRRKNEEDQTIQGILGGLSDLSYMLRR